MDYNDARFNLNKIRNAGRLLKEEQDTSNLDGKANLNLNTDDIHLNDDELLELESVLKEVVDNVDNRITQFDVTLGRDTIIIQTAIEGGLIDVKVDLFGGNDVNEQVTYHTKQPVKLSTIDKLMRLRQVFNPKRVEPLINLVKG